MLERIKNKIRSLLLIEEDVIEEKIEETVEESPIVEIEENIEIYTIPILEGVPKREFVIGERLSPVFGSVRNNEHRKIFNMQLTQELKFDNTVKNKLDNTIKKKRERKIEQPTLF